MKRKALCFILTLLALAVFTLGCGGGGGSSNPASSNIAGNARVSGVVYDSSNKPISDASVRLVLASKALTNSLISNTTKNTLRVATAGVQTEFNTTTDNKGQFTFVNVPYGEYTLSAVTEDKAQFVSRMAVSAPTTDNILVILQPFGSIEGVVTDSSKAPLKGALVYIDGTSYCCITDTNGAYTLKKVPTDTELNLCAMASGYDTKSNIVKIVASESLTLDSGIDKNVNISLEASTQKAYSVKCNIIGNGKSLEGLLVFAFSDDGNNVYSSVVSDASCTIKITNSGKYTFIPAYLINGYNQAGTSYEIDSITDRQIQDNGNVSIDLTMGALSTISSNYASLNLTVSGTGKFTACLYDSVGQEHKKVINGGSSETFGNLPQGTYSLAVYSDSMLKVETGIELSAGQTTKTITPVAIAPTFETVNGIATITLDFSSSSPITSSKDDLRFSVLAINNSETKTLKSSDLSEDTFGVTSSEIKQGLSIDNLNSTDEVNNIKFSLRTAGLDKPVFEKVFELSHPMPMATNLYKKIQLKRADNSVLELSNTEVILFKTVTYNSNIYYVVVTSKDCLVYDSEGALKNTFDFESNISEFSSLSDKKIKYGNAAFYEGSSEPVLALQFISGSTSGATSGASNVYIYKFNFSLLVNQNAATQPQTNSSVASAFSANKLLFTSDGTLLSVCDNFVLVPSTSTSGTTEWKKVYFGDWVYDTYTPSGYSSFNSSILASFTTIIPNGDNSLSLCYLNFSTKTNLGNNAYKIFLGIDDLDSGLNSSTENHNYEIGYFDLEFYSDVYPEIFHNDSNNYNYCSSNLKIDTFPYNLTDCLDNADALDKVFVNVAGMNSNYVTYNKSVYFNNIVRSSYRYLGDSFTAYIKRTSKGECFKLINQSSLREQSIEIDHQIFNSVDFLEGSIGYSNLNSKKKAHVIYADSDKYINILVLNCIESNN